MLPGLLRNCINAVPHCARPNSPTDVLSAFLPAITAAQADPILASS